MVQVELNKITPEQFTYWLQGYIEVNGEYPTKQQWAIIKDHLQEVFNKVTPSYTTTTYIPNGETMTITSPSFQCTCGGSFQNTGTRPTCPLHPWGSNSHGGGFTC